MKRTLLCVIILTIALTSVLIGQTKWDTLAAFGTRTAFQSRDVVYLPSGVIWVQGANAPYDGSNFILLSTDNGTTWTKRAVVDNATVTSQMLTISAIDANTCIAGLTTGEIFRTTNGGVKWDTVMAQYDISESGLAFIDGIKFLSSSIAIAYGDADNNGTFIGRSTDAGATWTRATNLPDSSKRVQWFAGSVTYGQAMDVYNNTVWCAEYYGANKRPFILKSTDAGVTWTDFPISLPGGIAQDYYLRSINFKDENVGFGVIRQVTSSSTTGNYLVKTTDGGTTWSDTISVNPGANHADNKVMSAKWIRGTNTVIAVGYGLLGAKAWISTDDGSTWNTMNAPLGPNANADLRNIAFVSATQGMAVGNLNDALYHQTTAVNNGSDVPSGYALAQNYPNPFNPSTIIEYSVPSAGHVELRVFDLLGRTVATLVNGDLSAGTHRVTFNATGLPSGTYFYSMHAGSFSATKALVLVK